MNKQIDWDGLKALGALNHLLCAQPSVTFWKFAYKNYKQKDNNTNKRKMSESYCDDIIVNKKQRKETDNEYIINKRCRTDDEDFSEYDREDLETMKNVMNKSFDENRNCNKKSKLNEMIAYGFFDHYVV